MLEKIKFLAVGGANTAITYAIYLLLLDRLGYTVSYAIAYVSGIVISYLGHTLFSFNDTLKLKSFLQYPAVYAVQFLSAWVIIYVLINALGVAATWAPLFAIVLTLPLTFIMSKWIIKGQPSKAAHHD
jgi:putative flippase GtrA